MPPINLAHCPACGVALPMLGPPGQLRGICGACKTPILVAAFPRSVDPKLLGLPAELRSDEESSACFFHPAATAVEACMKCGRFLCSTCDLKIGGSHFCSDCLERAEVQASIPFLVRTLERYDIAAATSFSLPIGVATIVALFLGTLGRMDSLASTWVGLAIFIGIFAVPNGIYYLYKARRPQTGKPKPTYTLIRILVLFGLVWLVIIIFGILGAYNTM